MYNSLIDASVVTMIGNLPDIINRNNRSVAAEFSYLFDYAEGRAPKLTTDVDAHAVTAHTGYFQNLNFSGNVLNASVAESLVRFPGVDASVKSQQTTLSDHESRIAALERNSTNSNVYGSSVAARTLNNTARKTTVATAVNDYDTADVREALDVMNESSLPAYTAQSADIDLSDLFSARGDGVVQGSLLDDITHAPIYRVVDGVRIPLQVGSMLYKGKVMLTVFHDHMTQTGGITTVQRIYVPVRDDRKRMSVVQAAPAASVTFTK